MGEAALVRRVYRIKRRGVDGAARAAGPFAPLVAGALALVGLQGCAMSLPSLWERKEVSPPAAQQAAAPAQANPEPTLITGSVRRPVDLAPGAPATREGALAVPMGATDWAIARRALVEALADRADTPSVPWDNPQNGARGTITALQRSHAEAGRVCRGFLGSRIEGRAETWFEGRACGAGIHWDVVEVRPWRRS